MQLHPAVAFTAARLGGLVGALLARPAVGVLETTIFLVLAGPCYR